MIFKCPKQIWGRSLQNLFLVVVFVIEMQNCIPVPINIFKNFKEICQKLQIKMCTMYHLTVEVFQKGCIFSIRISKMHVRQGNCMSQ